MADVDFQNLFQNYCQDLLAIKILLKSSFAELAMDIRDLFASSFILASLNDRHHTPLNFYSNHVFSNFGGKD